MSSVRVQPIIMTEYQTDPTRNMYNNLIRYQCSPSLNACYICNLDRNQLRYYSYITRVDLLVKMSAWYCFVLMWWISIWPGWTLSLNQWYLIPICLVREDISGPLPLAKFCAPMLSSQALETWDTCCRSYLIFSANYVTKFRANTNSLIH